MAHLILTGSLAHVIVGTMDCVAKFAALAALWVATSVSATSFGPLVVFMENESAELSERGTEVLESLLKRTPTNMLFYVAGHTDRIGKAQANRLLSCKRGLSVRAFLLSHGVPAGNIVVEGFGEERPVVETADEVVEAQNRRVEISVYPADDTNRREVDALYQRTNNRICNRLRSVAFDQTAIDALPLAG